MAESEEELKSLLRKVKESEKVGLKLNIQKTKIMASGPITSWGNSGNSVRLFIFWGSKIQITVCLPVARLLSQEGRGLGVGSKGGPR